jgi:hypothetical protein
MELILFLVMHHLQSHLLVAVMVAVVQPLAVDLEVMVVQVAEATEELI